MLETVNVLPEAGGGGGKKTITINATLTYGYEGFKYFDEFGNVVSLWQQKGTFEIEALGGIVIYGTPNWGVPDMVATGNYKDYFMSQDMGINGSFEKMAVFLEDGGTITLTGENLEDFM